MKKRGGGCARRSKLAKGGVNTRNVNVDETAVYGCHCPGNKTVRMRKELAIPQSRVAIFRHFLITSHFG